MSELSVRFTSVSETAPILISLFRPNTGVSINPVSFTPPPTDKQLVDLRWYLQAFSFWPSLPDNERAERIENNYQNWGHALLARVLVTPNTGDHPGPPLRGIDPARLWQEFIDVSTTGLTDYATTR